MRKIKASGINNHLGFSILTIEVVNGDGRMVDSFKFESQTLSSDQLWNSKGRKLTRQLKKAYGVAEVCKPAVWRG